MINMSITPSLTERTGQATSRFGDTVPILSVREADTLVRVHEQRNDCHCGTDGRAGEARAAEGAVPRRSARHRAMFRGETTSRRKTDLVILLTPTVMTPARIAEAAANRVGARLNPVARLPRAERDTKLCTRNITGSRKSRSA